ncbi:MAG: ATP-binding protein [Anaerolineaceae bacterium]|nr:ATP-binding protein [Anaerolineaceae bacterium]
METPTSISEINLLIDNQIQENIHLDYKSSAAIDRKKVDEISKDVSAFANSDGGVIIYGVIEKDYYPEAIDMGVEHSKYNREWIEQIINSNIAPRVDGIDIKQIPIDEFRSLYVLNIPKSYRGPHQAKDNKYYKRFNFQSVPMEDYEIRDISNRQSTILPLINIDIEFLHGNTICVNIENIGDYPAYDVKFDFPDGVNWPKNPGLPPLLQNGTKVIPKNRKYSFYYHSFVEIVNNDSVSSQLDIDVSYINPLSIDERRQESFHFDFLDFINTIVIESEYEKNTKIVNRQIGEIISELKTMNNAIDQIGKIAGPTGLNFSYSTLINLRKMYLDDDYPEKYFPYWISRKGFQEILNIDFQIASQIYNYFNYQHANKPFMDITGMSEELKESFMKHFIFREEDGK